MFLLMSNTAINVAEALTSAAAETLAGLMTASEGIALATRC